MTRDEAIAEIQRGIGFRSDQQDNIIRCLVQAQENLERGKSLPHWTISEDEELSLTASSQSVALPANFIREVDDMGENNFYVNDLTHMVKIDYSKGVARFANATALNSPTHYALRANALYFFPAVSADLTLTWSYYAKQESLISAAGNTWLDNIPYLLIGIAGQNISSDLRDVNATAKFTAMKGEWMKIYLDEMTIREEANQPRSLGDDL